MSEEQEMYVIKEEKEHSFRTEWLLSFHIKSANYAVDTTL